MLGVEPKVSNCEKHFKPSLIFANKAGVNWKIYGWASLMIIRLRSLFHKCRPKYNDKKEIEGGNLTMLFKYPTI